MPEVKHIGRSHHRVEENPLEKVFALAWAEQNDKRVGRRNGVLELLLLSNGDGKVFGELTHVNRPNIAQTAIDTEAILALAQVQWPTLDESIWQEIVWRRLLLRLIQLVNLGMRCPR